ncbi:MAG: hypothetical protein IJZ51_06260 [Ruminiclostridium sp.]|nr:hypothetical protein [Ruminiclostridium sp.]
MKKHLLKAVCLLLSVSLLCSCGTPEDESVLSSVPETAGQVENSVDEAISGQETSIADSESKSESTKKPETEENSVAETTTETTTTTTKVTETESTPKPETTTSATTTKKPETVATPKPETTTTTTSKKPETTVTPKPETTTTTTTKAPETTTIATEKPDDTPTGHCEGFDKLWGKTLVELGEPLENEGFYYNYGWEFGEKGGKYLSYGDYFNLFGITLPYNGCCYSTEQGITLLYEVQTSVELHDVYGFNLWGGGEYSMGHFEFCKEKKCPDYDMFFNKLKELYGEPDKSRIDGILKVHMWSNTLDGDILLSNYVNGVSVSDYGHYYDTVNLYVLESNHEFSKEHIDYHFSLEI